MGNDSPSGLSPGYRRGTNPPSPSPFRRSLSSLDSSWHSLGHRHKFLLSMLGLLTLLCTVYLYFAVTLGTSDSCSGLGGNERVLCQRANTRNDDSVKAHHRRLLYVEDADSSETTINSGGSKEDFLAFLTKWAASIKGVEESETTRLKGAIIGLQRTITSLRRSNTRLRKTISILQKDHHILLEDKHKLAKAIPVPPTASPVPRKVTRLRGNI